MEAIDQIIAFETKAQDDLVAQQAAETRAGATTAAMVRRRLRRTVLLPLPDH